MDYYHHNYIDDILIGHNHQNIYQKYFCLFFQ
ncbi:hypothetical protein m4_igs_27 [Acanthamoeba polyphaga mimivirus]|nr:hypothetical protein m4_igs_27 [Acanthamoeba polyphaga mimivirus]